jgi:hypothetical protein
MGDMRPTAFDFRLWTRNVISPLFIDALQSDQPGLMRATFA